MAEMEGYILRCQVDLTKEFADRTLEEKEFFATNGYWPNEVDPINPAPLDLRVRARIEINKIKTRPAHPGVAGGDSHPLRVGD
jgi:hypothetical protein